MSEAQTPSRGGRLRVLYARKTPILVRGVCVLGIAYCFMTLLGVFIELSSVPLVGGFLDAIRLRGSTPALIIIPPVLICVLIGVIRRRKIIALAANGSELIVATTGIPLVPMRQTRRPVSGISGIKVRMTDPSGDGSSVTTRMDWIVSVALEDDEEIHLLTSRSRPAALHFAKHIAKAIDRPVQRR